MGLWRCGRRRTGNDGDGDTANISVMFRCLYKNAIELDYNETGNTLRCLKGTNSIWALLEEVFCPFQHQYPCSKGKVLTLRFIRCCLPTWYNDNVTFKHSSQRNWATAGQDQFMENYFESQRENIFQHCEADTEVDGSVDGTMVTWFPVKTLIFGVQWLWSSWYLFLFVDATG